MPELDDWIGPEKPVKEVDDWISPPTTRAERIGKRAEALGGMIQAIPGLLDQAGKHAKGLMTGEVPPTPENVLPAASMTLNPTNLARGAVASAASGIASMPKYAGSGSQMAEQLAGMPIVGKPIRDSATKAISEYDDLAMSAVAPEGKIPTQLGAGQTVQRALNTTREMKMAEEGIDDLPWRVRHIAGRRAGVQPENVPGRLASMAQGGGPLNLNALSEIKAAVPPGEWDAVQRSILARMGKVEGGFDPSAMIRAYSEMPAPSKGILFGSSQRSGLRTHLDSLAADAAKIERLRAMPESASVIKGGMMAAGAFVEPMTTLASVLGGRVVAKFLSRPETAAPLAQWSKAFVRIMENGGTPGAMAAFKMATTNLENSTGEKIDIAKLIESLNPISSAQAAPRSIADINKPLPEEEEARRRISERIK